MGLLSILHVGDRGPAARRHRRTFTPSLMLGAENLESRIVLSHTAAQIAAPAAAAALKNFVINSVQLTNLQVVDNVLHAAGTVTGTLAGLPFTATITDFALQLVPDDPTTPLEECSVLDLELGPINLNLLGLHVDTSPICLSITAFEDGGLLGDLLCGLAGGGLPVPGIPTLPTADQLTTLVGGLTDLLNGALSGAQPSQGGGDSVCTGECEILDLSLGPVDLDLLGVNVHLDDCNDGPVLVCVSATPDGPEGGILGSLLCFLADTNPDLLSNLDLKDITKLVNKVTDRLEGGNLSLKDISKLAKQLDKLVKK